MDAEALRSLIRDVPDFPKPGILFRDITPLLLDASAFRHAVEAMAAPVRDAGIDRVLGIESRGFLFGTPIAQLLGTGFALIRKPGKLPYDVHAHRYDLEYGSDTVEMHVDAVVPGQRVLLVDDLIATGGTAAAAARLVQEAGAIVAGCSFLIELSELQGVSALDGIETHAVIRY